MNPLSNWFRKTAANLIEPVVKDMLQKSAQPTVTEVPSQMQIGYQYTGGARRKFGGVIDFDSLRSFSAMYDVARACINYRKNQISNLEWAIVPKDAKADPSNFQKPIDQITAFFNKPSHNLYFRSWIKELIEDMLVLDAIVLWKDKTYGKELRELLPIDGATIRLRVAEDGTTPEPPTVAYEQILYGEPKGSWTTDEMYYKIYNPRTNNPYGLSPLESLVIGVDGALRSQMYNNNMLSEGSVPEGFFGVPPEWTPDQIKDYQMWFDALMAGNGVNSSRIKFMPGGKGVGYIPTKKTEDMRYLEFEKWLLMKCCAVFDVPPEAIGFIENVTRTTSESQQQFGQERGLIPTANFFKEFFTHIIEIDFGRTDLKFEWKGLQVVDDEFELDRADRMIARGAMTINEWRNMQGMEAFKEEAADKPLVFTTVGPMLLETVTEPKEEPVTTDNPQEDSEDQKSLEEMDKWEDKCINFLKRGKGVPKFSASYIDEAAKTLIEARLSVCKSKEEIRAAFRPFRDELTERVLIQEVSKVSNKVSKFKRSKYEYIGQGIKGVTRPH